MYRKVISEYEGVERTEYQLAGKLISMGTPNEKNKNTNGKGFIINTVRIPLPNGKEVDRTAICYEGNYAHPDIKAGKAEALKIGGSYLTTLRKDEEGNPQLQMSHLTNANRASAADFAGLEDMFEAAGEAGATIKSVETAETEGAPVENAGG